MVKKQSIVALVLLLLIPVVLMIGGILFSLINPEIAAGHPNYVQNYHRLNQLKLMCLWGSFAVGSVLWILVCLLLIRSKKRSYLWLFMAALGPFGFAVLAMLNDREPLQTDKYSLFVRNMRWPVRVAYELCIFIAFWMLAYQGMVLKRILMIRYQAATTGLSVAQIMDQQDASGGMWAFAEGNEVIFLVVLLYLLRPLVVSIVRYVAANRASPRAS
ncbi:MAG: hypothetical protein WCA11_06570 [Terracidiphilus sp.]